jgi:hypothetical protein
MKHIKKFNESFESEKWALFAGLSGGFGGANFKEFFEGSRSDAERSAYQLAVEEYESYADSHGLRTTSDIMEEDGVEEDEAEEIYNEEMEGWLDYYVEEFDSKKDYN